MAFILDGKPLNELDASQIARLQDRILLGILKRNVIRSENAFNSTKNMPWLNMVIAEARKRNLRSNYLTLLDPPPCSFCGTGRGLMVVKNKTYCRKPLCLAVARRRQKEMKERVDRHKEAAHKLVSEILDSIDKRDIAGRSMRRTKKFGSR